MTSPTSLTSLTGTTSPTSLLLRGCPVGLDLMRDSLARLGRAECSAAVRVELDWAGPIDLPLHDETGVQAACGIMHVHGRATGGPRPLGLDYASTLAGVLAAQGVLAALISTGRGLRRDTVRTSVGAAALLSVSQYLAAATCAEPDDSTDAPGTALFTSADGVPFEIETLDAECWQRFWRRLGADERALRSGWPAFQRRFATATCPLPPSLREVTRRLAFPIVLAEGIRTGVSVVAVCRRPPSPDLPWEFRPLPASVRPLGTPAILPLEGVVVVESTRRVQGPMAGHLLRLLGAEVIRIEPPGGDPMRGIPPLAGGRSARFAALNDGKRVVRIDLHDEPDAVRDLVRRADVFLHNWAPGKAAHYGLDAADLAAVRPGLVYAWASGWGERFGPCPPIGTDYLVQAHSGIAASLARQGEPPAPSLMTLTDVLGGLVCAQGVLAALLTRLHTGRGSRVDSSLRSAAELVPLRRTERTVPPEVCTDLRDLATDPRFARALTVGEYATPVSPWEFG